MKKKSVNRSKDRDKNDDAKSHKHSRRRRKSSSSESEDELAEVQTETSEDTKTKRSLKKNEQENNVGNTVSPRITRHSRRLAAINASSEDLREEISESLSSPVKTGKSSPYSSGSPRKRDSGTPDKHRTKEQDVWKVKSANGAGSGELQKLKICRQRSPETLSSQGDESTEKTANDYSGEVVQPVCDNETENTTNVENSSEDITVHSSNEVDLASIQLPPTEVLNEAVNFSPAGESIVAMEIVAEINHDDSIWSEQETRDELVFEKEKQKEIEVETAACEGSVEVEKFPDTVAEVESVPLPAVEEETTLLQGVDIVSTADEESVNKMQLPPSAEIDTKKSVKPAVAEELETQSEEKNELVFAEPETVSEQEDGSQAEIVLTVDENAIEESGIVNAANEGVEEQSKTTENIELRSTELTHSRIKQVEDEEIYDYENDDAKEEGELSGNEALSPIHEVFKKYPADERKQSWGLCSVFRFERSNIIADEQSLKNANIKKRTVSKEELDASDSEDLIFVKEIREENIVHEIESETNNTSHFEREDDDPRKSPKTKSDSAETRKKKSSESDKIEKPSKRHSKENKSLSGEGKTVLYITNLVRPFTVNQFRELLLRTGRIVEDGFWIDSIKSKCYVQFESEDEALETRHALHGIRWPVNNPKVLNVQFATQDDLLSAQAQTHESEIPRKTEPLVVSNHSVEIIQKRIDWKKHFEQYDERPRKKVKDVREWDIGKPEHPDEMVFADMEEQKRKEEQERLKKNRKDKRKRNDPSDDEASAKKQKKSNNEVQPPAEAKLLDDLFRRTKASPSIYWLPLSEEQIAVKQEARRKHLEDIDRQMKKRGAERDSRRRDRERRHSRR